MQICIEELGSRVWKWFDLPVSQNDINSWVKDELTSIYIENGIGGIAEEFEVTDTDGIKYLGAFTSYETYNDYYDLLEEQNPMLVEYAIENLGSTISQLITDTSIIEDLICYECNITEYVDTMIDDGVFGEIPPNLILYIDTIKLGNDMLLNGDVNEFSYKGKDYIIF